MLIGYVHNIHDDAQDKLNLSAVPVEPRTALQHRARDGIPSNADGCFYCP